MSGNAWHAGIFREWPVMIGISDTDRLRWIAQNMQRAVKYDLGPGQRAGLWDWPPNAAVKSKIKRCRLKDLRARIDLAMGAGDE